jgi:phenylalanine-4-hydroxylase
MNKQAQDYSLKLLNSGIFDRFLELGLNFGSDSPRDSLFQLMALLRYRYAISSTGSLYFSKNLGTARLNTFCRSNFRLRSSRVW